MVVSKEATSAHLPAITSHEFYPIVFSDAQEKPEEKTEEIIEPTKTISQEEKFEQEETIPEEPIPEASSAQPVTQASIEASTSVLRNALVNIVCQSPLGSNLHSISGSGVLIDPKGIILTNAHIAQYFLLGDQGVSCIARTGSPATDAYRLALIFISSKWVEENADILSKQVPYGTGEHDFAFVVVTKSVSRFKPLPESFPFIPLAKDPPLLGAPVVIGGYGAQFLGAEQIQFMLFPTLAFGSIKEVFTFGNNTVDVIALGGSAAAQQGSSGGGVADAYGELVGTIVTSTQEQVTADRSLDAITASYIRSAYASETGEALDLLLARSVQASIEKFQEKKKILTEMLLKYVK